jgi:2-octaprenyl-6-methoxyphenol hydroxylase
VKKRRKKSLTLNRLWQKVMQNCFDIVIVGGGMVGAALACALKNENVSVALIDAASAEQIHQGNDPRLIALNYNSFRLLTNLSIWPELAALAAPIQSIHISTQGQFGATRLQASKLDLPCLGHVVPAKFINSALYSHLKDAKNLQFFLSSKIMGMEQGDLVGLKIISNNEEQIVYGKKIIAADGTHSTMRELLNIESVNIDYDQEALVTTTELQRSHQNIAYERFTPTGAIAMLPLTEQRVATIWSDTKTNIQKLKSLSDEDFVSTLQKEFGYRLGKLLKTNTRHSYPLLFLKAKQQVKDNIVLLGNAAHTLHPVAAQGLNLAFYEIALIADNLELLLADTNQLAPLFNTFQQKLNVNFSHRLNQLFNKGNFPLRTGRQVGMMMIDSFQVIHNNVVTKIMARSGRIPSLLQ